jgi:hypothetical protein
VNIIDIYRSSKNDNKNPEIIIISRLLFFSICASEVIPLIQKKIAILMKPPWKRKCNSHGGIILKKSVVIKFSATPDHSVAPPIKTTPILEMV